MNWEHLQRGALIVGGVGAVLCGIGLVTDSAQFFASYLFAYLVFIGIALGCLAVLMSQYAVRAVWGLVIRRLHEAGAATLGLLALLFIPILLGVGSLYHWAQPSAVAADPLLQHKALYLNVPFFTLRAVIYFAIWIILIALLRRWSGQLDVTGDFTLARRMHRLSIAGLVLFMLTATFAMIDWVMSLEPDWYSTVYAIMLIAGGILAAFALMIVALSWLSAREPVTVPVTAQTWNDLGNLLMAILLTWAYLEFSQFLVIWSGNLNSEIPWYLRRLQGGWQWVAAVLILFSFAVPFLLLLSRRFKRNPRNLGRLAALLAVMSIVNSFWLVAPAFHPAGFALSWLDFAALAFIGGLWVAAFAWVVKRRSLMPLYPMIEVGKSEVVAHGG